MKCRANLISHKPFSFVAQCESIYVKHFGMLLLLIGYIKAFACQLYAAKIWDLSRFESIPDERDKGLDRLYSKVMEPAGLCKLKSTLDSDFFGQSRLKCLFPISSDQQVCAVYQKCLYRCKKKCCRFLQKIVTLLIGRDLETVFNP